MLRLLINTTNNYQHCYYLHSNTKIASLFKIRAVYWSFNFDLNVDMKSEFSEESSKLELSMSYDYNKMEDTKQFLL